MLGNCMQWMIVSARSIYLRIVAASRHSEFPTLAARDGRTLALESCSQL